MGHLSVKRVVGLLMVLALLVAMGAGCTKYASEEDLQTLDNAREAAEMAETKAQQLMAEKGDLERERAALEAELQAVQMERERVADRIADLSDEEAAKLGLGDDNMGGN